MPSSASHPFSAFLSFLEVTGGPEKCDVSAKQDSGSPRSEALGSCRGKGRLTLWVVLRQTRETVSQASLSLDSHLQLIPALEAYMWIPSGELSHLVSRQQNHIRQPITAEGKPCSVLLTGDPFLMCFPELSQGLLASYASSGRARIATQIPLT